jgi:hypothetical protein
MRLAPTHLALLSICLAASTARGATLICPPVAGQKVTQILVTDGGPRAPDGSNEDAPSGDTLELPPVPGGYFAQCGYAPNSAPSNSGVTSAQKIVKIPGNLKICKITENPLQYVCK